MKKPKPDIHKDKRRKIILFIQGLKRAAENPITKIIAKAILGRSSDAIIESIRKWSALILKGLELTDNGFNQGVAVTQAAKRLSEISKPERAGYYKMIGGELYSAFTGESIDDSIIKIEQEYQEMKLGGLLS